MAPYAEIRSFDQWNLLLNMKKVFRFELFKPNVFDTYQKKGDFDYDFSISRGCIFRLLRDYSKNLIRNRISLMCINVQIVVETF